MIGHRGGEFRASNKPYLPVAPRPDCRSRALQEIERAGKESRGVAGG